MHQDLSDVESKFEQEIGSFENPKVIHLDMENDTNYNPSVKGEAGVYFEDDEKLGEGLYFEDDEKLEEIEEYTDIEKQGKNYFATKFFEATGTLRNYENPEDRMELKRELYETIKQMELKYFLGGLGKKLVGKLLPGGLSVTSLVKKLISKLPEDLRKKLFDMALSIATSMIPGGSLAKPIIKGILGQIGLKFENGSISKSKVWEQFSTYAQKSYENYASLVLEHGRVLVDSPVKNLLATSKALELAGTQTQNHQGISQIHKGRRKKKVMRFKVDEGIGSGKLILYSK